MDNTIFLLKAISDIITAGGAIIAFSLLIYSITFQLKDRVTQSFIFLLACVVLIIGADAFFTTIVNANDLNFLLRLQFIGLIFLPTAYFFFSDALLAITGKPSKGKRVVLGYLSIGVSLVFIYLNLTGRLFSDVQLLNPRAPSVQRTLFFDFFSLYFIFMMVSVWYNFARSLNRTATKKSNRRMLYLVISAFGPAFGSFPYLLYGSKVITSLPSLFWLISIIAYLVISISIVIMTYTVSFFGFPWPDRVIKSRLFKWIMRGPVTAILTLGMTTLISRLGTHTGKNFSSFTVLGMVATIVVFEFFITLFSPYWERLFFTGMDKEELEKVRQLEDKLLTKNDLLQFLELILATFCDQLQIGNAKLVEKKDINLGISISVGDYWDSHSIDSSETFSYIADNRLENPYIIFEGLFVFPVLFQTQTKPIILGFIAVKNGEELKIETEKEAAIVKLLDRTATALYDRRQQDELIYSLDVLTPQVSAIQNLLATSRFNQTKILNGNTISGSDSFEKYIKGALGHYFGGPKLSQSPLVYLPSVQYRILKENEPSITALRAILKEAIHRLRPTGDRQYTNEWMLFNILDLKFIEGWKVKDLCLRLSLSEADFYRKQRVAISAVADQIIILEQEERK